MMGPMLNAMRAQAAMEGQGRARTRHGIVSGYDPVNYCAKVRIQPEDTETGWLPVFSPWAGNGWGFFAPPTPGDLVDVHFQEAGFETGYVSLRAFNDDDRPLPCPSGEFWLVHKSGSLLKFFNDGSVALSAATDMTAEAPNGTLRLAGKNVQIHASEKYSWDSSGYGEHWKALGGSTWEHKTWQTGAVITSVTLSINPPEGP